MPLSVAGATVDLANLTTTPLGSSLWTDVAPAIGMIAAAVALLTAWLNRQIAVLNREKQRQDLQVASSVAEPSVLLPPRPAAFVNRKLDMERAEHEIRAGERLLAIQGDAGVGKSALAAELAHRLRSDEHHGKPGVRGREYLWIEGGGQSLSLAEICQRVTLDTGDQSLSTVAEEHKVEALRVHLARSRTVLVLDNVVLPAGSQLRALLRTLPSDSLVIAALNGADIPERACCLMLNELSRADVAELIKHETRRLGLADSDVFDAAFADRLYEAVGGNPALIESFLRRLTRSPRSVDELLDAVERGEGFEISFMPLWDQLSAGAQDVLKVCALLKGRVIAGQLTVACELGDDEVSAALAELLQTGLLRVVRSVGRPELYLSSPSVRPFVLAQTPLATRDRFAQRLAAFYVDQFRREPENAAWAVPHIVAIKVVLGELFDAGRDAEVKRLFAAALDILMTLGLFDDRISTGQLAYESAVRAEDHGAASLATDVLASTHAARGETSAALEAVAHGSMAANQCDDPAERARQMRAHGLVLYKAKDAGQALAVMEGADDLARAAGDLEVAVNVYGVQTVAHLYLGNVDRAASAAERGLETCREMQWQRATAYPLRNLAEVAIHRGDFDRARLLLDDARRIALEYGDRRQSARVKLTSARLRLYAGELREASMEALAARADADSLGLVAERREAEAIHTAAFRSRLLPPVRWRYARRRPVRLGDAPVGGD